MAFFLGIDGGGSKTECMVGNETAVLGWAGSSSSKIARVGEEAAGAALREGGAVTRRGSPRHTRSLALPAIPPYPYAPLRRA